ncbi:hypothetical protein D9611_003666 [Ephemerocybe angulata]|uniref:Uncharacterized protein n=1 Tax=Ephemerocybe angulata TaxID=980116 RepID=A0A8H5EYW0_9AGAR|nr:hypothetical protein D9611_003666 [Tulosesus angulatus]
MPRTRNVSRSQWDAANAQRNSRGTKKENAVDQEKENAGRVTRASTRTGSRGGPLGASGPSATALTTKGKGKEKPPSKGTKTTTEKLPLQDITARFLPAPESANRGYPQPGLEMLLAQPTQGTAASPLNLLASTERPQRVSASTTRRTAGPGYPSSLPPSSPPSMSSAAAHREGENNEEPSDLPALPPSPPLPNLSRRLFTHHESSDEARPYDAWNEFDYVVSEADRPARPLPTPRASDPFGFFALEKKLEAERGDGEDEEEIVDGHEADEDDDEEAAGQILVADTSSPRPVRRLKHKYVVEAIINEGEEQRVYEEEDGVHFQPPTPHKTVDRTRYSYAATHVDEELSSPAPSSSGSPSPSKRRMPSSAKRKAASAREEDDGVYEEEESRLEASPSQKVPGKKQAKLASEVDNEGEGEERSEPPRRQLRSRTSARQQEMHQKVGESSKTAETTTRKGRATKRDGGAAAPGKKTKGTGAKGTKSTSSKVKGKKKAATTSNKAHEVVDPDMEEWERERQARLEYFRKLEEYDYETENVYVV